jgi:hypothetical protein
MKFTISKSFRKLPDLLTLSRRGSDFVATPATAALLIETNQGDYAVISYYKYDWFS